MLASRRAKFSSPLILLPRLRLGSSSVSQGHCCDSESYYTFVFCLLGSFKRGKVAVSSSKTEPSSFPRSVLVQYNDFKCLE
ncbi:hypothetical protein KOW79_013261 [Hemibagrus wyckioides]|uniref:Uncharacterized protein n=1 Tax=Hemibagrus wyckioides TaxID=337641 RepID=A0A9D3NJL7_9TELE|nr:hypothetical protein KOW79_013261 [Hemibagrus wyckioides]